MTQKRIGSCQSVKLPCPVARDQARQRCLTPDKPFSFVNARNAAYVLVTYSFKICADSLQNRSMDDNTIDHAALEAGAHSSDADYDKEQLVEYSTSELWAAGNSADEEYARQQGQSNKRLRIQRSSDTASKRGKLRGACGKWMAKRLQQLGKSRSNFMP